MQKSAGGHQATPIKTLEMGMSGSILMAAQYQNSRACLYSDHHISTSVGAHRLCVFLMEL